MLKEGSEFGKQGTWLVACGERKGNSALEQRVQLLCRKLGVTQDLA